MKLSKGVKTQTNSRSPAMANDNDVSTEVENNQSGSTEAKSGVKYEVTKNPLEEKFGKIEFKKETEEKIKQVSHLSPFMKVLITTTMTKFYVKHVWDGKGEQPKSVNFKRYTEVLKHLDITEEQEKEFQFQYKAKDKLFGNQSDDLIAVFNFILPKNMDEYDTEQRTLTLVETVNASYLKTFGTRTAYTQSTMKAGDLSMIGDFNAQKLGVNPRDSIKKLRENNPNAINEMFKFLLATQKEHNNNGS